MKSKSIILLFCFLLGLYFLLGSPPNTNAQNDLQGVPPGTNIFPGAQEAAASLATSNPSNPIVDPIVGLITLIISLILTLLMWFLGVLLTISGLFVDYVTLMTRIAGSSVVMEGWTFTRDMLNFVFIIMLLVIAFSTIAGLESYGMKSLLPKLLISALLVNFSLAITGAFLQVANIIKDTALQGLQSSTSQGSSGSGSQKEQCKLSTKAAGTSLACKLATSAGINRYFSYGESDFADFFGFKTKTFGVGNENPLSKLSDTALNTPWKTNISNLLTSFTAVVFVALFVVAMIALAITLTVRVIVLAILCILAPVPYVFSIVPKAQKYASQWWDKFIQYTLFLPVVVFFLVLAIRLADNMGKGNGIGLDFIPSGDRTTASGIFGTESNSKILRNIFDMVFISIFMMTAMFVAKAMGIWGADAATGFAKNAVRNAAVRPTAWAAKAGGRATGAVAGAMGRGAGTGIAKVPGGTSTLAGARAAGRFAQRMATGTTSAEQMAAAQQQVKNLNEAQLKKAADRGNVGAVMELMDRGDLKGEDFEKYKNMLPKGSAAAEKFDNAYNAKAPVTKNTTITPNRLREAFAKGSTAPMKTTELEAIHNNAGDIRAGLKKMKNEDVAKNQEQIRAAIQASIYQIQTQNVTNSDDLALSLSPDKINAYNRHLDAAGQKDLEKLLGIMETHPSGSMLSNAQQAAKDKFSFT